MARKEVLIPGRFRAIAPKNRARPLVVISDPPEGKFDVLNIFVDEQGRLVVEYDDGT